MLVMNLQEPLTYVAKQKTTGNFSRTPSPVKEQIQQLL